MTNKLKDSGKSKSKGKIDWLVLVVAVAVVLFWLIWAFGLGSYLASSLPTGGEQEKGLDSAGKFGDMFGGINALFTAFAFVAVWWTGRMQARELELQRRELRLQRRALRLQRGELADTRTVMARQTFESMFFQMLRLNREIHDAISYMGGNPRGTAAMRAYAGDCRGIAAKAITSKGAQDNEIREELAVPV